MGRALAGQHLAVDMAKPHAVRRQALAIVVDGSTKAPGRDTTNAAQADHSDGATRSAASPNTRRDRSSIH